MLFSPLSRGASVLFATCFPVSPSALGFSGSSSFQGAPLYSSLKPVFFTLLASFFRYLVAQFVGFRETPSVTIWLLRFLVVVRW
jgi:hypothetical protein